MDFVEIMSTMTPKSPTAGGGSVREESPSRRARPSSPSSKKEGGSSRPASPNGEKGSRPNSPKSARSPRGRSRSPTKGRGGKSGSPTRFAENDFDRKRDVIDPEQRKKALMKARGIKTDPKDWTKQELMAKILEFGKFTTDRKTNSATLALHEEAKITSEEIKIIDELFRRVNEIQILILNKCHLTDDYIEALFTGYFKQLRFIKEVQLCKNNLTMRSIDILIEAFARRTRFKLEILDLRGNSQLAYEEGWKVLFGFPYLKALNGIEVKSILSKDIGGRSNEPKALLSRLSAEDAKSSRSRIRVDGLEGVEDEGEEGDDEDGDKGDNRPSSKASQRSQDDSDLNINPYISSPSNTIDLTKHDLRIMETGILCAMLSLAQKRIHHLKVAHNQLNSACFFYIMNHIKTHNSIHTLDISHNPITANGVNLTMMEALLSYIQRNTSLLEVKWDKIVMPESLHKALTLSLSVNRSVVFGNTNPHNFYHFIEKKIWMSAKPSTIPEKFRDPTRRYNYGDVPLKFNGKPSAPGSRPLTSQSSRTLRNVNTDVTYNAFAGQNVSSNLDDYAVDDKIDEAFIRRNKLPICDVKLTDQGFFIKWKEPARRKTSMLNDSKLRSKSFLQRLDDMQQK